MMRAYLVCVRDADFWTLQKPQFVIEKASASSNIQANIWIKYESFSRRMHKFQYKYETKEMCARRCVNICKKQQ